MSEQRQHIYNVQIQSDWDIILNNVLNQQQSSSTTTPSSSTTTMVSHDQTTTTTLDLLGTNDEVIKLQTPTMLNRFWLNITRISPQNDQDTIYQHIDVDYDPNNNNNNKNEQNKAPPLLLTSDAVEISNLQSIPINPHQNHDDTHQNQQQIKNSYKAQLYKSINNPEANGDQHRVLINTTIQSPYSILSHLHQPIFDSKNQTKLKFDENDEKSMRLRPGDLDSDYEDYNDGDDADGTNMNDNNNKTSNDKTNNNDKLNLNDNDPNAMHRQEYRQLQQKIRSENQKLNQFFQESKVDYLLPKRNHQGAVPIVNCVAINPVQNSVVASGSERGDLRVWDSNTSETLFVLHQNTTIPSTSTTTTGSTKADITICHVGDITSVKWLQNGSLLLSTSIDCTTKLWLGLQYGKCIKTMVGHNRTVVMALQHEVEKNKFFTTSMFLVFGIFDHFNVIGFVICCFLI
jgi:hypothetical protein